MFSRFTAAARRVMQRAFREAKRCQHDFVGTEHLLYGLCYDPDGPAVALLRALGGGPELLLEKVDLSLQTHDGGMAMEQFPLSPASKRVFRAAAGEAAQFNHQMIGPEHLLLGLLCEHECTAAQILTDHGIALEAVRAAVARIPPDAYHDAQVRAADQARLAPSDNPTAAELEDWIAPDITHEMQPTNQTFPFPGLLEAGTVEGQLRRTQMFLGSFAGFLAGYFLVNAPAGVMVATLGAAIAWVNNFWVSLLVCCAVPSALLFAHMHRMGQQRPLAYVAAIPLGILLATFLSDLWRFPRPPAGDASMPPDIE